jgi:hypothetical protein
MRPLSLRKAMAEANAAQQPPPPAQGTPPSASAS